MIRVAHIWRHTDAGGSEATFMRMYAALDHSQVQFDFLVENTGLFIDRAKIESLGGRVFLIPPITQLKEYRRVLREIFQREKYDIVHSHINELGYFPLKVAQEMGIPIRIAHAHSGKNLRDLPKTLIKILLRPRAKRVATHWWAVSEHAACQMFGKRTVANHRVTIFYNALNLRDCAFDADSRAAVRRELQIGNHQFVVGHVGRLTRQKNHAWLLRVFAQVLQQNPDAVLLLVGEGNYRERIMHQCARLGLTDHVRIVKNHLAVAPYYQAMDVFVLPSLYEGLPGVAVEAQYNGLPCVLADTITREAKRGTANPVVYLPLKNVRQWADVILQLNKTRNSIDVAQFQQFDMYRQTESLVALYQGMVTKGGVA